jgi:hypothetical protein
MTPSRLFAHRSVRSAMPAAFAAASTARAATGRQRVLQKRPHPRLMRGEGAVLNS